MNFVVPIFRGCVGTGIRRRLRRDEAHACVGSIPTGRIGIQSRERKRPVS